MKFSTDDAGSKIISSCVDGLREGKITKTELAYICDFIRSALPTVSTDEELVELLTQLTTHWNLFSPLLHIAQGVISEQKTDLQAQQIQNLLQTNKVDEAYNAIQTT